MSRLTEPAERLQFSQLHQAGHSYAEIARRWGVSAGCVRLWCRRQRAGAGVANRYYNPRAGVLSQFSPAVRERIAALRRAHPRWGPASLWVALHQEAHGSSEPAIPSRASIGRFLASLAEFRPAPQKKSA